MIFWLISLPMSLLVTPHHPDSPIFQSNAAAIQLFFAIQVVLSLTTAIQAARWLRARSRPQ